jgi:Flp pilus assembly protein CpaB
MTKQRFAGTMITSFVLSCIGIIAVHRVLYTPQAQSKISTKSVVVALRDIAKGGAIERGSVTVNQFPIGTVPVFAYASLDSVVGRVASMDIYRGEVIVPGRLAADITR